MSIAHKDLYYVAVKAFLERDNCLLVCKDRYGDWDIPGGRLEKSEFETPLEDVLRRKLAEELGDSISYEIGAPVVMMRHERVESIAGAPTIRIFAVGYAAAFKSGAIRLSPQHVEMIWAPLDKFVPSQYFKGGWLTGVEDYLRVRNAAK